jgi:serine/threonine protein kinase
MMAALTDLAGVLVECRVVSRTQVQEAALAGGKDLPTILNALTREPPHWWDGKGTAPPGLTPYQREMIELRFEADELPALRRDLALNHFLLLDKLGQGGQGEVYRARQLNPARFAAVKTLVRDTEIRRRRFEQEARTMMKIQHPAVARFYLYERVRDAAGQPTDEYLIAMEFVNGTDLNRLVRRLGPIPWQFAVHWTVELLGGLAAVHRHGVIHRDVKPENVMVVGPAPGPDVPVDATCAKLLDFGAVKQVVGDAEDGIRSERVFVGTAEYAPPEQWTGGLVAASDVYALGGTLYFALTGKYPYQKPRRDSMAYMNSHMKDPILDIREVKPDVPAEVNRVFQRMMAKTPEGRGAAAELIDEFRRLLPKSKPKPAPKPKPAAARPKPAPSAAPPARQKEAREVVPRHPVYQAFDPVLLVLERIFIPGHLRPPRGEEPALHERLASLLRRPLMLLVLLVLLGLLVLALR